MMLLRLGELVIIEQKIVINFNLLHNLMDVLQNEVIEDFDMEDKQEMNDDDLIGTNALDSGHQNSIVHSTTDFYRLVETYVFKFNLNDNYVF